MTSDLVTTALASGETRFSEDEARRLTDEVKDDAAALWTKLLRLYEGNAHLALGYASWHAYARAEFDLGQSRAYQMLDAARVAEATNGSTNVEPIRIEAQARALAPLLNEPEQLREAWAQTINQHGPRPTAAQVRSVVREAFDSPERREMEDSRPDDFDPAVNAEMLRRSGAFKRLLRDLTNDLGTPAEFIASQRIRDHATASFADLARQGIGWLEAFLDEWEST